jgi:multidrug resistance efflux pump
MLARMRVFVLGALVLAACTPPEEAESYSGTIEFPDVAVGSLVAGRVLEVRKQEGDEAEKDEVLVQLDPASWESQLAEAEALADATARELDLLEAGAREEDVAAARAEARRLELLWEVLRLGARPEEIAQLREDVSAAAALLAEVDGRLDRERDLVRSGSSTAEKLDAVIAQRETARARKAAAEQRLQLAERGARPEEIEAARQAHVAKVEAVKRLEAGARKEEIAAKRATLEAAQARIRLAQTQLRELTIRAPEACRVQTLDLRPGDLLAAGAPVAMLLLRDNPWVTIHVPERDLAKISLGQRATIRPDGHPELPGRVFWISRVAEYAPRNVQTRGERTTLVFAAKVAIEGDPSNLKDGMWADVSLKGIDSGRP